MARIIFVTRGAVKYFGKIFNWTNVRGPVITRETAEKGKEIAKAAAPFLTGALYNKIATREARGKGYYIVSRLPMSPGTNARRRVPRAYHAMMHGLESPDISGNIKSGNPRYMDYTYKKLKEKYPEEINKSLVKTLRRT